MKVLGNRAQTIINHLYWVIFTCNKNGKELIEGFLSLKHHISNKHTFPQNRYYRKRDHPLLSTEQSQKKQWLEMGSAAHEKFVKIIFIKRQLLILSIWPNKPMLSARSIRCQKIYDLPKITLFQMKKMGARTQIAALDHNNNINRSQVSKFLRIWKMMKRYVS